MMSSHHVHAGPCRRQWQQHFPSPPGIFPSLRCFGRDWMRVQFGQREIKPHSFSDLSGTLRFSSSVVAAAARGQDHHTPWRTVTGTGAGFGDRCNQGQPAIALVSPSWNLSTFSRNACWGLRRGSPVNPIFIPCGKRKGCHRRGPATAVIKAREFDGKTEECGEADSQNGAHEWQTTTAMSTAKEAQTAMKPNSSLSIRSRNAVRDLRTENLGDPIQFTWREEAGIKANKSVAQVAVKGRDEKVDYKRSGRGNMGRRAAMLLGGSTLWTSLGCCRRCCGEAVARPEWNYVGPCGSAEWEGLCTSGYKQSPVDITSGRIESGGSLGVLDFVYAPSPPSILNNGHGTIQVSFMNGNNVLKVRGQTLQLLQFHFHAPSEHAFNGEHYAMEAHLVHRDPVTRKLAVVGVMMDATKDAMPNKCLAASLAYAPREHGQSMNAPIQLSPSFLLPPSHGKNGSRGYVHYGGSLTTPPCSEGVEWFVLDTPLKISSSQVLDFMRFSGDGHSMAFNSRPLQQLGNRTVFKGP